VPCSIDIVDSSCSLVSCWHLQLIWRCDVHQLQRWLRVSCWIDVIDSNSSEMSSGHVQRGRRNIV
jgi:hypothetical protein